MQELLVHELFTLYAVNDQLQADNVQTLLEDLSMPDIHSATANMLKGRERLSLQEFAASLVSLYEQMAAMGPLMSQPAQYQFDKHVVDADQVYYISRIDAIASSEDVKNETSPQVSLDTQSQQHEAVELKHKVTMESIGDDAQSFVTARMEQSPERTYSPVKFDNIESHVSPPLQSTLVNAAVLAANSAQADTPTAELREVDTSATHVKVFEVSGALTSADEPSMLVAFTDDTSKLVAQTVALAGADVHAGAITASVDRAMESVSASMLPQANEAVPPVMDVLAEDEETADQVKTSVTVETPKQERSAVRKPIAGTGKTVATAATPATTKQTVGGLTRNTSVRRTQDAGVGLTRATSTRRPVAPTAAKAGVVAPVAVQPTVVKPAGTVTKEEPEWMRKMKEQKLKDAQAAAAKAQESTPAWMASLNKEKATEVRK